MGEDVATLRRRMAAKKVPTKSARIAKGDVVGGGFAVVLEDLRGQFDAFGEALQGLREHIDRRFDSVDQRFESVDRRFESVERQLGLLTDAVRTHSRDLRRIETGLDGHDARLGKLEGAAE
jgi:chromosome segregation ATPase